MSLISCTPLLAAALLFAGEKPNWEEATVISRNLGSQPAGVYTGPLGGGTVAVPINANSNIVVIETDHYRYVLNEPNLGGAIVFRRSYSSSPLILPVNGKVQFYRDGDWFIFMDRKLRLKSGSEQFLITVPWCSTSSGEEVKVPVYGNRDGFRGT